LESIYSVLLFTEFSLAVPIFILLFFVRAPYGKFLNKRWGSSIKAAPAWALMEFPALILPLILFIYSGNTNEPVYLVFIGIWMLHYIQRTLVYPLVLNRNSHKVPLLIIILSLIFNLINGWINGYGVFIKIDAGNNLLYSFRFITGLIIFLTGFIINMHSDSVLRNLRTKGDTSYKIPQKGLFKYICCPHYLGEIIEWTGWALLTCSPAAAAFLVFTIANLVPRAVRSLEWYRKEFPDYPAGRKAIIPFIL